MAISNTLTISGKVMGKTRPIFTDWELVLPAESQTGKDLLTLADLLSAVVTAEVEAFRSRQTEGRLHQILTPDRITQGLDRGKITSGGSELDQAVDLRAAIDNALQSFADGFYYVFIDEEQQTELDKPVKLQPRSQLMFLRLTPLVGG
jgi:hypothetical protein